MPPYEQSGRSGSIRREMQRVGQSTPACHPGPSTVNLAFTDGLVGERPREMSRAVAAFRQRRSDGRGGARPRDAELLEARAQRAGAESEDLGGIARAGDPPAAALEHAEEVRALHVVEAVRRPAEGADRSAEGLQT